MITAKEAREKSIAAMSDRLDQEKNKVRKAVEEAAIRGDRECVYSFEYHQCLSSLMEWLGELGYQAVGISGLEIRISW